MLPNLTITPAAAKFINRIVRFAGLGAGAGLRLAVTPGGCSGYASEFSPEACSPVSKCSKPVAPRCQVNGSSAAS